MLPPVSKWVHPMADRVSRVASPQPPVSPLSRTAVPCSPRQGSSLQYSSYCLVSSSTVRSTVAVRVLILTATLVLMGAVLYSRVASKNLYNMTRFQIHETKQTCYGTNPKLALCRLQNAYYWKGQLYFVTKDPAHTKVFVPHFALPHAKTMPQGLISTVTPDQLARMMRSSSQPGHGKAMMQISQGILYYRIYVGNYYHTLWEGVANVHMLACKVFGKCEYNPIERDLQVFFIDPLKVDPSWPHAQMYQCVSTLPFEETPYHHIQPPVRIHQLSLGLGPEAVGQQPVVGWRKRPSTDIMASLVRRMRACMGLPAVPPSVSEMKEHCVSIVQRPPATHGRSISNVDQVQQWLGELLPSFRVQVVHMEGKTLQQQAELWASSTIVVSPHGAQLSNAMYMPNNSFVLEVDQYELRGVPFYKQHVLQPLVPYVRLGHGFITAIGPQSVNVSRKADLTAVASFANFTEEQQNQWLHEPHCKYSWLPDKRGCYHWLKYYTDIIITREQVEVAMKPVLKWLKDNRVRFSSNTSSPPGD